MMRLYRRLATVVSDRWCGGLHAGLVIKGIHLQWGIRPYLAGLGSSPKLVFDAGCGPQAPLTALLAARYPAHRFEGWNLFVDEPALRDTLARRHLQNLTVTQADLRGVETRERYDVVYSIDVLEHIVEYQEVLGRLARSLRPRGTLLLHVPSLQYGQGHGAHGSERDWSRYPAPRPGDDHVRDGFDPGALQAELTRVGLKPVRTRWTFGMPVARLMQWYRAGEHRGVGGIGIALLPAVVAATLSEILIPPGQGEGIWLEAVKA